MGKPVEIDTKEFQKFFNLIHKAAIKDFKGEIALWFEACGFELLRVVQDEIIRKKSTDTRLLLNSFEKDNENNVWKVSEGGLTLEVGTNVDYAQAVNNGHVTVKKSTRKAFRLKDGTLARWVPGRWEGDKFEYDPHAKTGMLLKQKWVEGSHYWDNAIRLYQRIFKKSLERKMQEWMDRYFRV